MLKEWDGGPFSHRFANGRQLIVEGQGHFTHTTAGCTTCRVKGIFETTIFMADCTSLHHFIFTLNFVKLQ